MRLKKITRYGLFLTNRD